jgi:hypothetical protein
MKFVLKTAAISVAAALLLPAAAHAQRVAYDRFDQIDTDRNGAISRAEWDAATARGPAGFQSQDRAQDRVVVVPGASAGSTVAPPHPGQGSVSRGYPPTVVYDAPAHTNPNEWPPTTRYGAVPPR